MDRLPSNMKSMLDARRMAGITSQVSSMNTQAPRASLKSERDAIIENCPKYPVLTAYFEKIVAKACAEDEEESE